MKKILYFSLLVLMVLQFSSCELMNNEEAIPTYIQIDTIMVQTQSTEGSNSHKIKDAWIFVNNQLIGAFELPALAPVLNNGEYTIEIFAGIADNGILATPEIYPFYNRYQTTKTFTAGQTLTLMPTMTYDSKTKFPFDNYGSFENGNLFSAELDGNDFTKLELTTETPFEGNRCGKITLTNDNSIYEGGTAYEYEIVNPDNLDSPIYLEFNYKNNMPFEVGIMGFKNNTYVNTVYVAGLNKKTDWNKVYINLTKTASGMDANSFKVVFHAAKGSDIEIGEIFLDNVKLLHF